MVPLPGIPILATPVPAGFPSPADDYVEGRIDLNEHHVRAAQIIVPEPQVLLDGFALGRIDGGILQ